MKTRKLSDNDWNQLVTIASGMLPLTNGDLRAAMVRALEAHNELIRAVKSETITANLPEGEVTMFVPDGGGVALRLKNSPLDVP